MPFDSKSIVSISAVLYVPAMKKPNKDPNLQTEDETTKPRHRLCEYNVITDICTNVLSTIVAKTNHGTTALLVVEGRRSDPNNIIRRYLQALTNSATAVAAADLSSERPLQTDAAALIVSPRLSRAL